MSPTGMTTIMPFIHSSASASVRITAGFRDGSSASSIGISSSSAFLFVEEEDDDDEELNEEGGDRSRISTSSPPADAGGLLREEDEDFLVLRAPVGSITDWRSARFFQQVSQIAERLGRVLA